MARSVRRRSFLAAGAGAIVAGAASPATAAQLAAATSALAAIETNSGGRLGVCARDLSDGRTILYRDAERFPMCSTFKVLAVAAVLQRVDRGGERLSREIRYGEADLEKHAPVTRAHVAAGQLTIEKLCEAAIVVSDNTAANLLLRTLGGPAGVNAFVRARPLDDPATRLDRNEPTLNSAIRGDIRDTTQPSRMAHDVTLLLMTTRVLTAATSRLLEGWMNDCTTGTGALRAGIPRSWKAADKTGSGANGTRNDVAMFRRNGAPIVVAAYLTEATKLDDDGRDAALAAVGRVVAASFSR